jgi:hypothetical protein
LGKRSGDTEAEVVIAGAEGSPVAKGAAKEAGEMVPGPSTDGAFVRIDVGKAAPGISGPFADIADHVVEAETVRGEGADREPSSGPDGKARFVIEIVRFGRGEIVAAREDRGGSAAAGILPLGFGRQAAGQSDLHGKPGGVGVRFVPGDADDGQVGVQNGSAKRGPFRFGDGKPPEEKTRHRDLVPGQLDRAGEFVVLAPPHEKTPFRDPDKVTRKAGVLIGEPRGWRARTQ